MEVIVDSDQIRRIGYNVLDKIYNPLKKQKGIMFSIVYIDDFGRPRIAVNDAIFFPKVVYILKEDYLKFKSVIPLPELEFAKVFEGWIGRNYDVHNFEKLTTTSSEKMSYVKTRPQTQGNFNY